MKWQHFRINDSGEVEPIENPAEIEKLSEEAQDISDWADSLEGDSEDDEDES